MMNVNTLVSARMPAQGRTNVMKGVLLHAMLIGIQEYLSIMIL